MSDHFTTSDSSTPNPVDQPTDFMPTWEQQEEISSPYEGSVPLAPPPPVSRAGGPADTYPAVEPSPATTNGLDRRAVLLVMSAALLLTIGLFFFIVMQRGAGLHTQKAEVGATTSKQSSPPGANGASQTGTSTPTNTAGNQVAPVPGVVQTAGPGQTPSPTQGTPAPTYTAGPGTPSPTVTSNPGTPIPGASPTATQDSALLLSITCATMQDHKSATVCIQSVSGATVSISVVTCDGVTDTPQPSTVTLDDSGRYIWSWIPYKSKGCLGDTVTVTARKDGESTTQTALLQPGGN